MEVTRPSWDEHFLSIATEVSSRSTCSRLSVGAVVVSNLHIVSSGYNGAPKGLRHCDHSVDDGPCTMSVHAEANALLFRTPDPYRTAGQVLYVTHAPCYDCAKLIVNANIERVVYKDLYRNEKGLDLLLNAGVDLYKPIERVR